MNYHSFVVKSGINFGMDYCIYRDSPEKVHSELCVRVVDAVSPSELTRVDADSLDATLRPEQLPYRSHHSNYCLVPPMPHPEGQHSAHGTETFKCGDASTGYYFDNLSWKTLSTITRVMPVRFHLSNNIDFLWCLSRVLVLFLRRML